MNTQTEVVQPVPTQETLARDRAALDVQGNPRFVEIMQQVVRASTFAASMQQPQTQSDYDNASNFLIALKSTQKELKSLKDNALKFPKLYEASVRDAVRSTEDMLGKAINQVEALLIAWAEVVEAMNKQAAEQEAQQPATIEPRVLTDESPSVGALKQGNGSAQPPPTTTVKSDSGSVHVREYEDVTVDNMEALLKAILSKSERYDHCTVKLVQPNMQTIKEVLKGRRKIPGVTVNIRKGTVTRSK